LFGKDRYELIEFRKIGGAALENWMEESALVLLGDGVFIEESPSVVKTHN
jgi:hypothetical protein